MRSGRCHCFFVDGSYWISWIRSFWNTTLPGVVAMLTPSSKAFESVIEILSWPLPRSMSSSRLLRPRTRFWPPVATVSRNTSGLVSAKFDGASASMYWRVKKSTFFLVCSGEPLDAADLVVQPARGDQVRLLDVVEQEVLVPVLVPEALVALRRLRRRARRARPIIFSIDDCHRPMYSCQRFICASASLYGFASILAASSMNACPRPSSSANDRARPVGVARRVLAHQLGALLGGGRDRLGERDGVVLGVGAASAAGAGVAGGVDMRILAGRVGPVGRSSSLLGRSGSLRRVRSCAQAARRATGD